MVGVGLGVGWDGFRSRARVWVRVSVRDVVGMGWGKGWTMSTSFLPPLGSWVRVRISVSVWVSVRVVVRMGWA